MSQGPAGIVREKGVDEVLETLEGHIDFAEGYQRKFFEGERQAADAQGKLFHELKQVAVAVTARLEDIGVKVIGAYPEEMGRGARFVGTDREGREYSMDLRWCDEQRMRGDAVTMMLDGIDTVNMLSRAVREKRAAYLEEERLARLGIVRGVVG